MPGRTEVAASPVASCLAPDPSCVNAGAIFNGRKRKLPDARDAIQLLDMVAIDDANRT